jgi:DNA invertase Pin-like site-specific DNA recombinase
VSRRLDLGRLSRQLPERLPLPIGQRPSTDQVDALAVAKLDRLTRSLVGLADLMDWAKRNRLALIALDLGLDTSTDTGRLVARIMASVGEWERDRISDRTLTAMAVRRDQGKVMGLPGVRDTNPALAARIRTERLRGSTWQAIANRLTDEGVPTVRGGSSWRVSSVQSAGGYVRPPLRGLQEGAAGRSSRP